jgi:hypothetical protein
MPAGERTSHLAILRGCPHAECRVLAQEETERAGPSRFSKSVAGHLMDAMKNTRNGRFDVATISMLMRTTSLTAKSIRKWASRYRFSRARC